MRIVKTAKYKESFVSPPMAGEEVMLIVKEDGSVVAKAIRSGQPQEIGSYRDVSEALIQHPDANVRRSPRSVGKTNPFGKAAQVNGMPNPYYGHFVFKFGVEMDEFRGDMNDTEGYLMYQERRLQKARETFDEIKSAIDEGISMNSFPGGIMLKDWKMDTD